MDKIKYVIFPDIHGRTFWKNPVEEFIQDPDIKFIFLGDYLDPYPDEKIKDEYSILKNIIELKKKYNDRVILLLGNHDLGYLTSYCQTNRTDFKHFKQYQNILETNIELFKILHIDTVNDKKFCFSHAGILKEWLTWNSISEVFDETDNIVFEKLNYFNNLLHDPNPNRCKKLYKLCGNISYYRGGGSYFGSIVRADIREYVNNTNLLDIIQVVGHTMLKNDPININNKIYCLDCQRHFYLMDDGNIIDPKTNEKIDNLKRNK